MALSKPFFRTCRQFTDKTYADSGKWMYIDDPRYARAPEQYIRAFLILLKDLQELFDYVEPADGNLPCFSYRLHELLLRSCVEVEANCKAILTENGYAKTGDWNMGDYRKINASHRLSSYEVIMPFWHGTRKVRRPFAPWATAGSLPWYQAYNATKHDRHSSFDQATFENVIDAMSGLVTILSSQFLFRDFSPGPEAICTEGPNDGTEYTIGGYFRIKYPKDWPSDQQYDFEWGTLKSGPNPFQQYPYPP